LVIVDVSDVSPSGMSATGTTKKVTLNNLLACSPTATLASATITGDLTVDTSTLKVDSTNDRVGFGTASPAQGVHLSKSSTSTALTSPPVGGASLRIQNTSSTNNNFGSVEFYNAAGLFGASVNCQYTNQATPTSDLVFVTRGTLGGLEHYRIAADGVATWSEVGGVAGTAMTLNSTGLGVGVASPSYKLDVLGSGTISGRFKTAGAINALYLEDSGTTAGSLYIGTSGDTFRIITGSNVRVNVDSTGQVGIGVAPAGTGGCLQLKSGITFPATQVASSDANTLDDYEEGTWTGTLKGSVSDPTIAVTATGAYTKVGRLVHVTIAYSNVTTTGASGNVTITGLPFSGAATGAGSVITFDMFTTSTTLACWNVGTTIAFYVSGGFIPATHNAGVSRNLNVTFSYYV